MKIPPGQILLFDADDTLWENYIHFEQAIAGFIAYLDHQTHSVVEVREILNCCEAENIARIGYGLHSFEASLVDCFSCLMQTPPDKEQQRRIASFAHGIASQPVVLLPGVPEALEDLKQRHTLVLVTKGHELEQRDKLRRSGLQPLFDHIEVLPEKHADAYDDLRRRHAWEMDRCWMIGNSPKSDIHSSLAAGLNAVHVPHEQTWDLERCEIRDPAPPQQLLRLNDFSQLAGIF